MEEKRLALGEDYRSHDIQSENDNESFRAIFNKFKVMQPNYCCSTNYNIAF